MNTLKQKPASPKLFLGVAIAIPVVFFLVLEGTLRLLGFGTDSPLFIENPSHQDYMLAQPTIIQRYFPEGFAPSVTLEPTFFLKQKPDNGFRVVVQGGSTAAGYPYGLGASLAGMLERRLRQSLPEHEVEVINVAMSAVNSYFLLDTADEIIETQPDLVVIYAGHNEYLGIFGVGSTFTAFEQPWVMRSVLALRNLALFDALQSVVTQLQIPKNDGKPSSRTLMSKVAKHKEIPLDSDLYRAGLIQFEKNMNALLAKYDNAGIPVVISTIASNLSDHAPFVSAKGQESADSYFNQAKLALKTGKPKQALNLFIDAKDHDLLRFRAPEAINNIIEELSAQNNITLADSYQAMTRRSPNGIVGNSLMLEHLHPNVPGYFVIANTVYEAIRGTKLAQPFNTVDANTAWQNRPITVAEEYYGFAQVQTLMSDYPFTDSPTEVKLPAPADWQQKLGREYFEGKRDWVSTIKGLRDGYLQTNNQAMWLKTTLLLADALPHDGLINSQAMEGLQKMGFEQEADYYERRAQRAGLVSLSTVNN